MFALYASKHRPLTLIQPSSWLWFPKFEFCICMSLSKIFSTQIFPWKIETPRRATHPSSWLRFSELWILSLAQDSHFRQGRQRLREEEQRKETWYSPTAKDRLTSDNFKVQSFSIMCIFAFRPPWDYTNSSTKRTTAHIQTAFHENPLFKRVLDLSLIHIWRCRRRG